MMVTCYSSSLNKQPSHGVEKAKWIADGRVKSKSFYDNHSNREPLQFKFSSDSHINGWWCVRVVEISPSWQDNYLCTNRDIGLEWRAHYAECNTNMKCVYLPEIADSAWTDNALCLPLNSKVDLTYSTCGKLPSMSCVHLFDPSGPLYLQDNYICWKENAI